MFKIGRIILFFAIIIALGSCSKYQRLVKKGTPDEKYKAALKYYAKDDFYHSQQLFDELIVLYRGTDKLEQTYYYYSQTYYKQQEYIIASYHFKYFAKTFPKSQYAEECLYLSAYCKYLDSPPANLDQTSTKLAITDMQLFINLYPNSPKVEDANKIMDELRGKLVVRDFENAKIHVTTDYYKAGVYALNRHIKKYPATPFKEEAMYLIIQTNYNYAGKSVFRKQKERYTNCISSYNDYLAIYPEGEYVNKSRRYMNSAKAKIKKIDKTLDKRKNKRNKI